MSKIKNYIKPRIFLGIPIFFTIAALVIINWVIYYAGAVTVNVTDTFDDDSKIATSWNLSTSTPGEIKPALKEAVDQDIWNYVASTSCPNIYGDGDKLIVAKNDSPGTYVWQSSLVACTAPQCEGAILTDDNAVEYASTTNNSYNYPARQACKIIGGRLPTKDEIDCMYDHNTDFNLLYGLPSYQLDEYWSSSEVDSTRAYRMTNGNISNSFTKNYSFLVRCVKGL